MEPSGRAGRPEKLSKRIQASGTAISQGVVNGLIAVVVMLLFVQGCTYPSRMAAVPDNLTTKATVSGITNVRYWMDADPKNQAPYSGVIQHSQQRSLFWVWSVLSAVFQQWGSAWPWPDLFRFADHSWGDFTNIRKAMRL